MAPRKPTHDPCAKIIEHDRLLNGNGEKGILEKVEEHETFVQQWIGGFKMLRWILGSSLGALVISILGLILAVMGKK